MASTTTGAGWSNLPAALLVAGVLARLPFPGDRARVRAVCRAWRSAVRHHVRHQLPWMVLPDGSFCTTGQGGGFFFQQIPGLPENATCIAAAGDAWLALDCTDDVFRRTSIWGCYCSSTGTFVEPRPDVKHEHTYLLHNPFSNVTVPLLELDAIVGHVAETFEIRKVLMRSTPEDVIAVTTNNWNYNVILCRPGKGTHVLPNFRVIDVAFLGDTLYGVTSGEELVAYRLGEDEDGRPEVTKIELVIRNPMAAYYEDGWWTWPQDDDNSNGGVDMSNSDEHDEEAPQQADGNEQENQEEYSSEEEQEVLVNSLIINGDMTVSDNEGIDNDVDDRFNVPYEAFDEIYTGRYLVKSLGGEELLLVRHQHISSLKSGRYTLKVEVFKADLIMGKWVAANGLAKDEALFVSRSFSKSTRAQGDIEEGLVHYASNYIDDVFDTRSWTIRNMTMAMATEINV
nr:unnamed protein product [Digitaria exilis]